MTKPKRRSDTLPPNFTQAERDAYEWLYDCGFFHWCLNLATKKVRDRHSDFASLTEYAKFKGMKDGVPVKP